MAIKTKKISDLSTLNDISGENTFLLGVNGTSTGKIKYGNILEDVKEIIRTTVNPIVESSLSTIIATTEEEVVESPVSSSEIERLEDIINQLQRQINDTTNAYKELNKKYISFTKSSTETITALQNDLVTQTEKVAALEGFVQALQADGYLTLANIKKAAADACPICTHTHEEEQPTE